MNKSLQATRDEVTAEIRILKTLIDWLKKLMCSQKEVTSYSDALDRIPNMMSNLMSSPSKSSSQTKSSCSKRSHLSSTRSEPSPTRNQFSPFRRHSSMRAKGTPMLGLSPPRTRLSPPEKTRSPKRPQESPKDPFSSERRQSSLRLKLSPPRSEPSTLRDPFSPSRKSRRSRHSSAQSRYSSPRSQDAQSRKQDSSHHRTSTRDQSFLDIRRPWAERNEHLNPMYPDPDSMYSEIPILMATHEYHDPTEVADSSDQRVSYSSPCPIPATGPRERSTASTSPEPTDEAARLESPTDRTSNLPEPEGLVFADDEQQQQQDETEHAPRRRRRHYTLGRADDPSVIYYGKPLVPDDPAEDPNQTQTDDQNPSEGNHTGERRRGRSLGRPVHQGPSPRALTEGEVIGKHRPYDNPIIVVPGNRRTSGFSPLDFPNPSNQPSQQTDSSAPRNGEDVNPNNTNVSLPALLASGWVAYYPDNSGANNGTSISNDENANPSSASGTGTNDEIYPDPPPLRPLEELTIDIPNEPDPREDPLAHNPLMEEPLELASEDSNPANEGGSQQQSAYSYYDTNHPRRDQSDAREEPALQIGRRSLHMITPLDLPSSSSSNGHVDKSRSPRKSKPRKTKVKAKELPGACAQEVSSSTSSLSSDETLAVTLTNARPEGIRKQSLGPTSTGKSGVRRKEQEDEDSDTYVNEDLSDNGSKSSDDEKKS